MLNSPLKFGIVGAGGIAQTYALEFEKVSLAKVVGIADTRLDAARAMAERMHCQAYDTYQALAENGELDAVLICTPPSTHFEICTYFAKKKIHVLCEKPISTNSHDATRMLQTAKRENVILMMASKFRYVEDVIRAKNILTSGIIGEIVLFENAFTGRVDMTSRWNSNPKVSGGGVLIDNGTHSVDLMRYLLGPLSQVQVAVGKSIQGLAVEETVRVLVRSANGVLGSIDLSWSFDKQLDSFLNIYGSNGVISVGWKESKYRQGTGREWTVFGKGYDKGRTFRAIIENFVGAIFGKEALLITSQDVLASVAVIEACYSALQQNKWTSIEGESKSFYEPPLRQMDAT